MWISYYNDSESDNVCAMELVQKGSTTYETNTIEMYADETLDLTKVNKDAVWSGYDNKTFEPTSFDDKEISAYDEWGNLLGKYTIIINPTENAKLTIDQEDIDETTNYPSYIQSIETPYATVDGLFVEQDYSSSNEEVAKIEDGWIKFKGFGTAVITCTAEVKGKTYYVRVRGVNGSNVGKWSKVKKVKVKK